MTCIGSYWKHHTHHSRQIFSQCGQVTGWILTCMGKKLRSWKQNVRTRNVLTILLCNDLDLVHYPAKLLKHYRFVQNVFTFLTTLPPKETQHLVQEPPWPQFRISDPMGSQSRKLPFIALSRKLPFLALFCPSWVIDPELGSWELLNQVLQGSVICFSYSVLLDYTYIALGTEGYKVDYIFQFPQIAPGFQPI